VVRCGEAKHNRQLQLRFKFSQRASRYPNEIQELLCAILAGAFGDIAREGLINSKFQVSITQIPSVLNTDRMK
jgi:hypothetical protein